MLRECTMNLPGSRRRKKAEDGAQRAVNSRQLTVFAPGQTTVYRRLSAINCYFIRVIVRTAEYCPAVRR